MADALTLRLFVVRPAMADVEPVVDEALRGEVVRQLLADPCVRCAFVGRRGAGDADERIITTIRAADDQGDGDDRTTALPARIDLHVPVTLRDPLVRLAVRAHVEPPRSDEPHVLRVFRGEVRLGELDRYVQIAHDGALADAASNEGMLGLYLATDGPATFLTISMWTGWEPIERATGGNIRQPMMTRNAHLLVSGSAIHYEILAGGTRARP